MYDVIRKAIELQVATFNWIVDMLIVGKKRGKGSQFHPGAEGVVNPEERKTKK